MSFRLDTTHVTLITKAPFMFHIGLHCVSKRSHLCFDIRNTYWYFWQKCYP